MPKLILTTFLFFISITHAYAYLGPGMAGGVIVASLGIIFAILAMLFGLIFFPLKKFLKKRKDKKNKKNID